MHGSSKINNSYFVPMCCKNRKLAFGDVYKSGGVMHIHSSNIIIVKIK